MKKLLSLSALFVFAFFTLNMAIGQPNNYTRTEGDYVGMAYDGSEPVSGIQIIETIWNSNKYQVKITWDLEGDISGAKYEARAIQNNITHNKEDGVYNNTQTFHFFGKRNNVPMGYIQATGHVTITPDGKTTVNFYNNRWINFY